eukprot:313308_1
MSNSQVQNHEDTSVKSDDKDIENGSPLKLTPAPSTKDEIDKDKDIVNMPPTNWTTSKATLSAVPISVMNGKNNGSFAISLSQASIPQTGMITPTLTPVTYAGQSTPIDSPRNKLPPSSPLFSINEHTFASQLGKEKHGKAILTGVLSILIIVSLILGKYVQTLTGYHLIALALTLLVIGWMSYFLVIIFTMEHCHYIRVKRRKCPGSEFIFLPYAFEEDIYVPMTSISAIS